MKEGEPRYYKLMAKNHPERQAQPKVKADGKYYIDPINIIGAKSRLQLVDT